MMHVVQKRLVLAKYCAKIHWLLACELLVAVSNNHAAMFIVLKYKRSLELQLGDPDNVIGHALLALCARTGPRSSRLLHYVHLFTPLQRSHLIV